MKLSECLRKGLIKKDAGVKNNVKSSVRIAVKFLNSAKRNFQIGEYETVEIMGYNSAFHLARALLFHKGYKERSHHCLAVAIRELYKNEQKLSELIDTFDELRMSRHNVQYGGYRVNKEEAEFILNFVGNFLKVVKEQVE